MQDFHPQEAVENGTAGTHGHTIETCEYGAWGLNGVCGKRAVTVRRVPVPETSTQTLRMCQDHANWGREVRS